MLYATCRAEAVVARSGDPIKGGGSHIHLHIGVNAVQERWGTCLKLLLHKMTDGGHK